MEHKQMAVLKLPVESLADVSTSHIPRETSIALGEDFEDLSTADLWRVLSYTGWHDYGWIIFCSEDAAAATQEKHPALSALIQLCLDQKVLYLKLDRDAPNLEGMEVFEW